MTDPHHCPGCDLYGCPGIPGRTPEPTPPPAGPTSTVEGRRAARELYANTIAAKRAALGTRTETWDE